MLRSPEAASCFGHAAKPAQWTPLGKGEGSRAPPLWLHGVFRLGGAEQGHPAVTGACGSQRCILCFADGADFRYNGECDEARVDEGSSQRFTWFLW